MYACVCACVLMCDGGGRRETGGGVCLSVGQWNDALTKNVLGKVIIFIELELAGHLG